MGNVMSHPATQEQLAQLFVMDGQAILHSEPSEQTTLTQLFAADANVATEPEAPSLQRAVTLGNLMVQMQDNVAALQLQLEAAKADLLKVETEDLPELLKELRMSAFTLEDGSKIEVKPDIQCGITEARRTAAHAWLVEHDFGGLIKTEVVKAFDRDARDEAVALAAEIQGVCEEKVHPATLKAFIKEQLEAGVSLPTELFGIFPFNRAKLTRAKAAKKSKS